jgi:hypothetical protein
MLLLACGLGSEAGHKWEVNVTLSLVDALFAIGPDCRVLYDLLA